MREVVSPDEDGRAGSVQAGTARGAALRPSARLSAPVVEPSEDVDVGASRLDDGWTTVVWNDPVNLMSYVTYVFRSYFGYSQDRAEALMLQVHRDGRATVSRGNRERMEMDVQAMHGFGLWATVQPADG